MADKSQGESNQFVPVDHLFFYPFKMRSGVHIVEALFFFFFSWRHNSLEEMMLRSTASATAAGKMEADVLLTFQIIPLIPIWAHRSEGERLVRVRLRRQNRKSDLNWKPGPGTRACLKNAFPRLPMRQRFSLFFPGTIS